MLLDVIRRLAPEGITIVIIEHTMQAMVRLADRFVVLDHGVVIAEGAPAAVTQDAEGDRGLSRQEMERACSSFMTSTSPMAGLQR